MDPAFYPLPRVTAANCMDALLGKPEAAIFRILFRYWFFLAEMFLFSNIKHTKKCVFTIGALII